MIIRVNAVRRDASGQLIATVLRDRGGSEDLRLSPEDAKKVEQALAQNQFDLERYAGLSADFPAPDAIPVELAEENAAAD